ncbi:MAG: hypothetical protein ACREMP_06415 [Candidatus Tyrphobacter sp.]
MTPLLAAAALAAIVQSGQLPHGGTYAIHADPASPTAAVDLWFRAPDSGYDSSVPGLARVAATAAAAAKLESGRSLAEIVAQSGGRLSIEVFPDIVGIDVVVPPADARVIVASVTAAYFAPSLDDAALTTAKTDAAVFAVQQQYETGALEQALLFTELFASGPAHEPPIPLSPPDVAQITLTQAADFAKRAFRASNAFLSLAGAVDESDLSVVTNGDDAAAPDEPFTSTLAASPQPIARAGAVAGIGIAWAGPPIADERAATALDFIGDYLFRQQTGTVARELEREGDVAIGGQFITLHDPGVMIVTLQGSDDAAMQTRVLSAISAMEQPLPTATFDAALQAFLYHLAEQTQTAQEVAGDIGWYSAEGAPAYAPSGREYERVARSLDPQFVASIARRYLSATPAIVHITATHATGGAS